MKQKIRSFGFLVVMSSSVLLTACAPKLVDKAINDQVPDSYTSSTDSTNIGEKSWRDYFSDPNLATLIDSALSNNQELNIMLWEINASQAEILKRKGEYQPFVNAQAGAGVEKVGRYTSQGANDANTEIMDGKEFPDPLGDFDLRANFSWEIDIWRKLRNARDAAISRYLGTIEGKNFMVTQLVAEIANSYYELEALDNKLQILQNNIAIQQNALEIVKLQKANAKTTELAVKKFEAEVLKNRSKQYYIMQQIVETENRINFLVGRFPEPINRNSDGFVDMNIDTIYAGVPVQLFENRPDIKQAEFEVAASRLDVKVAKANFYPALKLTGGVGAQSFNIKYFMRMPQSLLYNMAGDIVSPLINRKAIKAQYFTSNARQIQAIYNYEKTILNAYLEVANQISNVNNLKQSYQLKSDQVNALTQSIDISTNLFKSARADYMEVLMTQRDALESKFELIEIKQEQMMAAIDIYRALGGGWR